MELNELYDEVAKENIYVFNYKMKKRKARIIDDNYTCIFVDYSKIKTKVDEKETIAEELGHYKYNAYYTLCSNQTYIDRQEYRAKKWKALHLCPLKSILSCVNKGIVNYFDIADKLEIDVNTLEFAIDYYKEQKLLS